MKVLVIANKNKEIILKSLSEKFKDIIICDNFEDYYFDIVIFDPELLDTKLEETAKKLKSRNKNVNIIICHDNNDYKITAFDIKASGYLIYPVTKAKLDKELNELRYEIVEEKKPLLRIQCFGNFSVYKPSGEIIKFSRSKCRELLAYLVYKCGSEVTTKEIGAILFEDREYDEKQQSYIQQIIFTLIHDLKEIGAESVIRRNYNSTSIDTSLIDCDYYRFNDKDMIAMRKYNGEFMMQYEWADYVLAYLDRNIDL